MRIGLLILFTVLLGYNQATAQPIIDKAGDGWDLQIDSALKVLKNYDMDKYQMVVNNCHEVSFWISNFSSCEYTAEGRGRVYVAVKDVKLGSINNLAVRLVHESLHLLLAKNGIVIPADQEENYCYRYELDFINKLPNPEPWLKQHALDQIQNTAQ